MAAPILHRVRPAGVVRVLPCLVRAFWDYPETRHLLPNEDLRRRVLPRYLGTDARDSARLDGLEAVSRDGVAVGAAAWLPPGAYPVPWSRQLAQALHLVPIAPWALGAFREARHGQGANRGHHRRAEPHYWLRALGVDPDCQGSGVGTQLVRSMLQRADAHNRGAFLFTATAANAKWYESFGFAVLATYRPTPTWPDVWAMWRDPE